MSLLASLNRSLFKRTSTFLLVVAGGTFFFERTFDLVAVSIFESINKGKLWKDIEAKYK
ncbi:cytochrome b-c1 complex subunit 9-like [Leguminivora glycinivorella]|uniref:cytochrome b-c1 complex subunit 9-like n=1 Tax=Leguminivora glycinivorella TaxID=1035111 RepID=UPI00200FDAE4|nr:cytochrome b-c1 complex subunit 9-like [Leguminivora glycinivorella]XP_048006833.1 cytochrome b-c1 complex subunit 9-like [Leguminivora glycinivorella]